MLELCLAGLMQTGPDLYQVDLLTWNTTQNGEILSVQTPHEHIDFFTADVPECSLD